jgi:transcriptional regulator with XRE-family HTH domain
MDARVQLGEQIRKLRTAKGLTLEELAFRAGMDYTHISGIERGRRNPSFAALIDLAKVFPVSTYETDSGFRLEEGFGLIAVT